MKNAQSAGLWIIGAAIAALAGMMPATAAENPAFRRALECSMDFNPTLAYLGLSPLTRAQIKGESHPAALIPAPPESHGGNVGFYVLTDTPYATYVETGPLTPSGSPQDQDRLTDVGRGSDKVLKARTERLNYVNKDVRNGSFEVPIHLSCMASFGFKSDGTPVRKVSIDRSEEILPGGVPLNGTCNTIPPNPVAKESIADVHLKSNKIDRHVVGAKMDRLALDDLRIRLREAMGRMLQNIENPKAAIQANPQLKLQPNMGVVGEENRRNACHLLSTFFQNYNECGTKALPGSQGLEQFKRQDPVFRERLVALHELYDTKFLNQNDTPECQGPVSVPDATATEAKP